MSMIHICIYMNIQCACSPNISIDIVKELIILLPLWKSSKWPFDFRLQGRFPRKSFCSMSRWVMKPILPTKKHAKIPWLCRPCIYWLIIFDPPHRPMDPLTHLNSLQQLLMPSWWIQPHESKQKNHIPKTSNVQMKRNELRYFLLGWRK